MRKDAKVKLHRETLRRLQSAELRQLGGGIKATGDPTACDALSGCAFSLCRGEFGCPG